MGFLIYKCIWWFGNDVGLLLFGFLIGIPFGATSMLIYFAYLRKKDEL